MKNLFIVGAQKAGTTTLANVLARHPQIVLVKGKEPNYFGRDLTRFVPARSAEEYESLFADRGPNACRIDASTVYLISHAAAEEIKQYDPQAKIVILLRDPIDMLHSWHAQMLYTGNESVEDFRQALQLEAARKRGEHLPPGVIIKERLYYTDVADYFRQVQRYLEVFGREAVKIILFEDFVRDVPGTAAAVTEFMGLDRYDGFVNEHSNPNTVVRSSWLRDLRRRYIKSQHLRAVAKQWFPGLIAEVGRLYNRVNTRVERRVQLRAEEIAYLRPRLEGGVTRLEQLLQTDLRCKWRHFNTGTEPTP